MAIGDLKWKAMLFGDDLFATIIDEKSPYKNKEGIEMKQYLIYPTEDLIDAYPETFLKEDALNIPTPFGRGLWVEYPTKFITDLNPSRNNAICRIKCGFDGRDTPYTFEAKTYLDKVEALEKENEILRINSIANDEEKSELLSGFKSFAIKMNEINEIIKGENHGREDEYDEREE